MKKFFGLNRKGFTLIEVIVVAAIIAILAGILVPMIFNQVAESRIAKVNGDCKTIQTAVMRFRNDLSQWPNNGDPTQPVGTVVRTLLNSGSKTDASELPTLSTGFDATDVESIDNQLIKNNPGGGGPYDVKNFKGPYLPATVLDPWGKAYVINADAFNKFDTNTPPNPLPVWVISGGPDGILQTPATATEICKDASNVAIANCDDIGMRIK